MKVSLVHKAGLSSQTQALMERGMCPFFKAKLIATVWI